MEDTCQPIINHISPSSGHLVEHIEVLSYRFMDYSNVTDCIDYDKVQFGKEFNFMVFTEDTGFYYNKECISLLQTQDNVTRRIPIKVYCVKTINLTLDMEFTVDSLNLLEECIFVVDTYNDTHLEEETNTYRCMHQKGFCEKGNPYHDLCHTYHAPIGGYRNIYCALCDNQTWYHYEKMEQCTGCMVRRNIFNDYIVDFQAFYVF